MHGRSWVAAKEGCMKDGCEFLVHERVLIRATVGAYALMGDGECGECGYLCAYGWWIVLVRVRAWMITSLGACVRG